MKIKDVEKEVGISAHSIRFYEEMGLIQVQRKQDSKYRDFSEQDVKKLKEIKLFRSLGITMEEIRRYYAGEISLEHLMEHQMKELNAQKEDMRLKEQLCEDIKDSKSPLVSYTVDQYQEVIAHKTEKLPYRDAGSLISSWGEKQISKHKIKYRYFLLIPFILLFVYSMLLILESTFFVNATIDDQTHLLISLIIAVAIVCFCLVYDQNVLPAEYYEFREKGIYYVNKHSTISQRAVKQAVKHGHLEDCFDFVAYDDIRTFKVGFRCFAKAPANGGNAYALDFRIFTTWDECIKIDTGILGTSDEKVRITAEILKEYAKRIHDPYHILEHLDDDRMEFYHYLDRIWWSNEYKRVGVKQK